MREDRDGGESENLTGDHARREAPRPEAPHPAVEQEHGAGEHEGQYDERRESRGSSRAGSEIGLRPAGVREDVDVGQVGADEQGRGAEARAPPDTGARQRGADQGVADRVYASLASSSICTLPLRACETGQPSLAFCAAASNPA